MHVVLYHPEFFQLITKNKYMIFPNHHFLTKNNTVKMTQKIISLYSDSLEMTKISYQGVAED